MDVPTVREKLCEVIEEIQAISGLECPPLNGSTRPARDVRDFSSEVWPIAIAMLEEKIDVEIPDDDNLFCDAKTKVVLSIDQCVERVMLMPKKESTKSGEEEVSHE